MWAKAEKKDAELQNMIAEQKIRTQRILGRLIQDGQRRGEIAKQDTGGTGSNQYGSVPERNTCKTLYKAKAKERQISTLKQNATDVQNSAPREDTGKVRDKLAIKIPGGVPGLLSFLSGIGNKTYFIPCGNIFVFHTPAS